jgi:hypothetical protein
VALTTLSRQLPASRGCDDIRQALTSLLLNRRASNLPVAGSCGAVPEDEHKSGCFYRLTVRGRRLGRFGE